MLQKYVFLKNNSTGSKSTDPGEMDVSLEVTELSKADIADLKRDHSVLIAIPDTKVSLIKPVESEKSDAVVPASARDALNSLADASNPQSLFDNDESTWGIRAVGADRSAYTGKGATVAVLDSGIDITHERFAGVDIVRKNFSDGVEDDVDGHGTHCAGTIFGQNLEGKPRIGVAPGIEKAIIGKVLGENGGTTASIAAAIMWAVAEGAQIISMSLGSDVHALFSALKGADDSISDEVVLGWLLDNHMNQMKFYQAITQYAQSQTDGKTGSTIIAASGNSSRRYYGESIFEAPCGTPAAAEEVISVGALGTVLDTLSGFEANDPAASLLLPARFSNYNNDISGPGVSILSSVPGGYEVLNGTSMATPHVAGVAALYVEKQLASLGEFNPTMLKHQLQGTATTGNVVVNNEDLALSMADTGIGLVQAP